MLIWAISVSFDLWILNKKKHISIFPFANKMFFAIAEA